MEKNESVLNMLVRERAAGCVSTGMCYSKNDNKDTNGSKGSMKI